jgi:outer membrane autotransporter protein
VGAFGVTFAGFSGELRPDRSADATDAVANVIELGGYWRALVGPIAVNARIGGDYLMAKSHRAINFTSLGVATDTGTATGHWNGWGVSSRVRASYEAHFGRYYVRPQVGLDVLRLDESAYTEHGGGVLDLAVGKRTTTEVSAFGGVASGAVFGDATSSWWGPELLLGYRDAVATSDGSTKARFLAAGDAFTVLSDPTSKGGMVARLAVKSESGPAAFSLELGGERRSQFNAVDAKIAAHFSF